MASAVQPGANQGKIRLKFFPLVEAFTASALKTQLLLVGVAFTAVGEGSQVKRLAQCYFLEG